MTFNRRAFLQIGTTATLFGVVSCTGTLSDNDMYGLINKITTTEGNRDALIAILLAGTRNMPGCLSYIISKDMADPNVIWITENWENKEKHQASLQLPSVQTAITKGRPLMTGMESIAVIEPVGGQGLVG